jgi:hypothetical protein
MLRNTVVIPYACNARLIAFSIRELANARPYTATLYVNGVASSLVATIPDGSTTTSIIKNGNVLLSPLDLVTIRVTWDGGALSRGVCISVSIN